jgi:hypothetical protein
MGFPGRFHASNAPTVAKEPTNTITTAISRPFPDWLASFGGSGYRAVYTAADTVAATEIAQTDQARQNATGAMCLTNANATPGPFRKRYRSQRQVHDCRMGSAPGMAPEL